jgi:hypothetical protein
MPDTGASRKRQIKIAPVICWRRRLEPCSPVNPARRRSGCFRGLPPGSLAKYGYGFLNGLRSKRTSSDATKIRCRSMFRQVWVATF